uniref:Uncharacterized protein n=1 Tax=Mycetohabitans sp. TaxID=2571162 RepID=A0A6B9HDF0_9BURK|nr:hypothetical protein [Mycetohabitans sp.]
MPRLALSRSLPADTVLLRLVGKLVKCASTFSSRQDGRYRIANSAVLLFNRRSAGDGGTLCMVSPLPSAGMVTGGSFLLLASRAAPIGVKCLTTS